MKKCDPNRGSFFTNVKNCEFENVKNCAKIVLSPVWLSGDTLANPNPRVGRAVVTLAFPLNRLQSLPPGGLLRVLGVHHALLACGALGDGVQGEARVLLDVLHESLWPLGLGVWPRR